MDGESSEVIGFEFLDDYYFENRNLIDEKNQKTFRELLEPLRQGHFAELPNLGQYVDHTGKPSRNLNVSLEASGDTVFFAPRFFREDTPYRYPDRLSFEAQPFDRLGREKSRHQVFFGRLEGQWFHEQQSGAIDVAIKPIPNTVKDHYKVLHEVGMHQYLTQYGLPALDVIGVIRTGAVIPEAGSEGGDEEDGSQPYGYVVSRTEADMETLNSLKWSGMDAEMAGQRMEHVLDTMALLHSHYIFHGDAEFRNIAVADSGRSLRVIDLEYARSYRDATEKVDVIAEKMNEDFSFVAKSIYEYIGYLFKDEHDEKQPLETYSFMLSKLFLPYYDRLLRIGVRPGDPLARAYDQMVLTKLEEARDLMDVQQRARRIAP